MRKTFLREAIDLKYFYFCILKGNYSYVLKGGNDSDSTSQIL